MRASFALIAYLQIAAVFLSNPCLGGISSYLYDDQKTNGF